MFYIAGMDFKSLNMRLTVQDGNRLRELIDLENLNKPWYSKVNKTDYVRKLIKQEHDSQTEKGALKRSDK